MVHDKIQKRGIGSDGVLSDGASKHIKANKVKEKRRNVHKVKKGHKGIVHSNFPLSKPGRVFKDFSLPGKYPPA